MASKGTDKKHIYKNSCCQRSPKVTIFGLILKTQHPCQHSPKVTILAMIQETQRPKEITYYREIWLSYEMLTIQNHEWSWSARV